MMGRPTVSFAAGKRYALVVTAGLAIAGAIVGALYLVQPGPVKGCPEGRKIVLAPDQEKAADPHIGGDWIAWARVIHTPKSPIGLEGDVYAYHIPSGKLRLVASGPSLQSVPRIHGDTLVWREEPFDGSPTRLMAANLRNESVSEIPLSLNAALIPRAVYGDWLVFDAHFEANRSAFFGFNLRTHERQTISNAAVSFAEIWNENVVFNQPYEVTNDSRSIVTEYNLTTRMSRILSHDDQAAGHTDIHGNWIAYQASPRTNDWPDIFLRNRDTLEETRIAGHLATDGADASENQFNARIGGDWVTYLELGLVVREMKLHAFHIPTKTYTIANQGPMQPEHDVWGNRAVFIDVSSSEHENIALYCIPTPRP